MEAGGRARWLYLDARQHPANERIVDGDIVYQGSLPGNVPEQVGKGDNLVAAVAVDNVALVLGQDVDALVVKVDILLSALHRDKRRHT
jgi:hypothetical protein